VASPMFGRNEQQDAHEFLLEYINQLHDDKNTAKVKRSHFKKVGSGSRSSYSVEYSWV